MDKFEKRDIRRKFSQAMCIREAGGKELRAKIQGSREQERYDAWNEKRAYGTDTRWILLAYGMFKGIPYKAIEAKVGDRNEAYVHVIRQAGEEAAGILLSSEAISAWLNGEPLPDTILESSPAVLESTAKPVEQLRPVEPKPEPTGLFAGIKRLFGAAS